MLFAFFGVTPLLSVAFQSLQDDFDNISIQFKILLDHFLNWFEVTEPLSQIWCHALSFQVLNIARVTRVEYTRNLSIVRVQPKLFERLLK